MSLHDTIMPLWGKTFLQLISIFVFSKSCTVSSGCLGKHLVVTISIHFLLSSAVFPWRLSQLLICCMPAPHHPSPRPILEMPTLLPLPLLNGTMLCFIQRLLLQLPGRGSEIGQCILHRKPHTPTGVICQSCSLPSVVFPLVLWACMQEIACINANSIL